MREEQEQDKYLCTSPRTSVSCNTPSSRDFPSLVWFVYCIAPRRSFLGVPQVHHLQYHLLLQGSEPSSYQVYLTFPCSYVGRWKQSSSLHATRDYTDLSHLSSASLLQVIHHVEAITDLWWPVLHYSILLAVLYSSEMKGRGRWNTV